jgi:hypothetical protein
MAFCAENALEATDSDPALTNTPTLNFSNLKKHVTMPPPTGNRFTGSNFDRNVIFYRPGRIMRLHRAFTSYRMLALLPLPPQKRHASNADRLLPSPRDF